MRTENVKTFFHHKRMKSSDKNEVEMILAPSQLREQLL